jgi:hypothetical protein
MSSWVPSDHVAGSDPGSSTVPLLTTRRSWIGGRSAWSISSISMS